MKKIVYLVVSILFAMTIKMSAQEFISSRASISSDNEGLIPSENESVLIQLNEQTSLFSVSSCILLKSLKGNKNDSALLINRQMYLNFKAPFPIDDLNFYDINNNEKLYSMSGELTIGEVTVPFKINFSLHGYTPQDIATNDIHSYPALISFTMEINPDDYRLENVPSCFAGNCFEKLIMVAIKNGTINKSNDSGQKPQCATN
jgi:hypothetical protein